MSTLDRQQRNDSLRSLGLWLSLLVLLLVTAFVFVADSRRDVPPQLQVKRVSPVTAPVPPRRMIVASQSDPAKSPLIRVDITPAGSQPVELEIRGPCSVRLVDSMKELSSGDRLTSTKIQTTATGLKIGRKTFNSTRLEVVPRQSPSVRVNDHLYRGTVRLYQRKDGSVAAVNVLPLEEYLASVVDSEMPAAFPDAAREAQAIVSRTYALYQKEHANPDSVADLFSSQRSQKYLGVEYTTESGRRLAGESESSRRAVAATRGIVCKDKGKLFCTYYSAVCGGQTTNGTELFSDASSILKSVPCEWCRESEYFRWTANLDRTQFSRQLQSLGKLNQISTIKQTTGPGGAISRFQIGDAQKSIVTSGVELRDKFPPTTLRSPHFSLALEKDRILAQGRGHGHGVGFCQWGARGQGLVGKSAQDIVLHYYPGAELAVINY